MAIWSVFSLKLQRMVVFTCLAAGDERSWCKKENGVVASDRLRMGLNSKKFPRIELERACVMPSRLLDAFDAAKTVRFRAWGFPTCALECGPERPRHGVLSS